MREKSFIMTSKRFTGSVLFKFGLNGFLTLFKIEADLDEKQHQFTLKYIPKHVSHIPELAKLSETIKVEEVPVDLSFEHFWKTYGNYAGKKKRCEALWEQLNDAERSKCLNYIAIYKSHKSKDGTALAYPETYINNRVWEN